MMRYGLLPISIVTCLCAPRARAQDTGLVPIPSPPPPISTVTASFGLGVGGFTLPNSPTCPGCTVSSPALGLSGRLGRRIRPDLSLGIAVVGELEDIDGAEGDSTYASVFAGYAYAQLTPIDGLFVLGGIGYGGAQVHASHLETVVFPNLGTREVEDTTTIGSGLAVLAGAGYEVDHVGRSAIAIEVALTRISLGDVPATYAVSIELVFGKF
jgi:hypothetical protein